MSTSQHDNVTVAKSDVQKQHRFCIVHVHSLIHQEMTWHTTARTSHQFHQDFIIEIYSYSRWTVAFNCYVNINDNVTVATSKLQNSAGCAPCISIVWSIKQWIGTRLCEHLIKSIMTSSSKPLFQRNQDSNKMNWHVQADGVTVAKLQLQNQCLVCIAHFHKLFHQDSINTFCLDWQLQNQCC